MKLLLHGTIWVVYILFFNSTTVGTLLHLLVLRPALCWWRKWGLLMISLLLLLLPALKAALSMLNWSKTNVNSNSLAWKKEHGVWHYWLLAKIWSLVELYAPWAKSFLIPTEKKIFLEKNLFLYGCRQTEGKMIFEILHWPF